jgi:hypothetical protein
MNTQFILLTQSVTGAVIEIVLLLLGAAIIGFVTAWFYQKHFYTPIIKNLEAEKADLNNQVAVLKTEKGKLNERILGLERNLEEKGKEIEDLKKPKK